MPDMLELEQVSVSYGSISAVRNVSLHIDDGEVVTLIGANGAGKTTLLKAISRLLGLVTGRIRLAGEDITQTDAHLVARRGIAHVPEGRRLVPNMTVEDNLRCGAFVRSDAEAIEADLERVMDRFPRLRERAAQLAATLSGGERQMVAIGRALMARPKLLMLDEPSLGLAPALVAEVFRIIGELRAEGRTILLIEQNATEALACSDRAYVLRVGEVVAEGSSEEVLRSSALREAYFGMH
jgi:branched-chain amino acid transport system ATP-binding protein